jgi:2-polyprenyl-3-methyl-5-hydroxy-6-metoxy-1,4-benzoquinol methylase
MYENKNAQYFSFERIDIAPLLPRHCGRVLELGCGDGATLDWLKRSGSATHATGIELCAGPAAIARGRADEVIEGDVDAAMAKLPDERYDTVLCLDVLEHLVDPWSTARRIHRLLRPGGTIIISLPNVRHYSVVLPLLLRGAWQYEDAGIMDRTHLRFFSRHGAQELLAGSGFTVTEVVESGLKPVRLRETWKRLLAVTPWRDLGVFQFLLRAEKPALSRHPADVRTGGVLEPAM